MFPAFAALLVCVAAVRAEAQPAPADPQRTAEPAPQLPLVLTLDQARELFRQRGFDLLIADANVVSAEGDLTVAAALPNPGLSFSAGKNFDCAASQDCRVISFSTSLSDNDLVFNLLTGKRGLRKELARHALEAARHSRDDAWRTLEFTLKQSWYQALVAGAQRDVARENRDSFLRTRQLNEKRFELGAMNEADLATIQVAHLEADAELRSRTEIAARWPAGWGCPIRRW